MSTFDSSPKAQQPSILTSDIQPELLGGEIGMPDYVMDVPVSKTTAAQVHAWSDRNREITRTNLAMWLVKMFACSLGATGLLAGAAAFAPTADKAFIKDIIPLAITPQATLLGVALTFYFTSKEEK